MRAVAIDDEPRALEVISDYAARIPFLSLEKTYTNAIEAIDHLKDKTIDLVFLDINMPDVTGIELVRSLTYNPLVIFSTAYSEHAVESYELQAVDYILKPYTFSRFVKAVSKAKAIGDSSSSRYLDGRDFMFVKTGYQQQKLIFKDIFYIEGTGNYITFHTRKGKHLLRTSLKAALNLLPKHLFVQVHKSYIVSLRNVDKIEDNHIFMQDKRIAIGSAYRDQLNKMLY